MSPQPARAGPDPNLEDDVELDPVAKREGYEDINERDEVAPLHYGISSFGADFPVDSLVKRIQTEDIIVPTFDPEVSDPASHIVGFQRDFVWTKSQSDRSLSRCYSGFPCRASSSFWEAMDDT